MLLMFIKDKACEEILAVWGTVQSPIVLLHLKSLAYYKSIISG